MWERVKLGEVCNFQNGRAFKKTEWSESGLPIIRIQNLQNKITDHNFYAGEYDERIFVANGDLLLSWSGTVKPFVWCHGDALLNQHVFKVSVSTKLHKGYAFYLFQNILDEISKQKVGIGLQHITKKTFENFPITLPPLTEQQRIVAKLDAAFAEIDEAIGLTEVKIDNVNAAREQQLLKVFDQPDRSWAKSFLQELTHQITDGKHGDCKNELNSGYYFLSAKDVRDGTLSYTGAREITKEDFDETHRRTKFEPGDILITNSGTIGRMAIAPKHERTEKTTFQKSVALIKPINGTIDTSFLYFSLKSKVVLLKKISQGAAQKNLLLRDLRALEIGYPRSVSEQKAIAERLSTFEKHCSRLSKILGSKLIELTALKLSILRQELQPPQIEAA